MPKFEFDPAKSAGNAVKHGIDFVQAQAMWDDPDRLEVPARTTPEPRTLVIARWQGKLWSAVVTERGAHIRIISVRRSRPEEEALYENDDL
jgi:uncharacterized DUF497 family protein